MNNTSFTDIPRNTQPQSKQAKSGFRKGAYVATAIQTKKSSRKSNAIASENSDSDTSIQITKKVKKKTKTTRTKPQKSTNETRGKV